MHPAFCKDRLCQKPRLQDRECGIEERCTNRLLSPSHAEFATVQVEAMIRTNQGCADFDHDLHAVGATEVIMCHDNVRDLAAVPPPSTGKGKKAADGGLRK